MNKVFFYFFILFVVQNIFANKPEVVEYISPLDGSELVSRSSDIIIRPGHVIDRSSLKTNNLITVIGSKSGNHSGRIFLANDNRTVIFKPERFFDPAETITVTLKKGMVSDGKQVPSFTFSFKITPLEQPLNPYQYIKELNPFNVYENSGKSVLQTSVADSFPSDFPRFTMNVTGETAPGSIFISPTHFVSGDGYNVQIDKNGQVEYYKKIDTGVPMDFKVQPNGLLSFGIMDEFYEFGGGGDTYFYTMDSSYTQVDQYQMGNGYIADFHEFQILPSGNFLLIAYDLQQVDMSKIVAGGHPGALIAGSVVQELDNEKNVVFQWRSWDHYKLTDSYADLTQTIFDAIHINSVELDDDKNFLFSTLGLAEVTKVNRKTGDIIWRMGGKNNQFTFNNDPSEHAPLYFMFQHDVRRLPNGNITMFDGGDVDRRNYSRAVEYEMDEANKIVTKIWEFRHTPDIFTPTMGSVQRLSNGNTMIGWGLASMYGLPAASEVDASGHTVMELTFNQLLTASYRATRYEWDGGKPAATVMIQELLIDNTYEFDRGDQKTGITLKFNEMGGFGYNDCTIRRYNYGPIDAQYPGKAPIVFQSRITIDQFNIYNINADITFDVDFYEIEKPDSVVVYHREFEGRGLFFPLPTEYNHATNKIKATMTRFGEFILTYPDLKSATFPPLAVSPKEEQSMDQTKPIRLEWTPVGFVNWYALQVATDADFNNLVVDQEDLYSAIYDLETPQANTTYYWRVKAYNDIDESAWSQTASFKTTAPYITVKAPNGGEQWRRGIEYFIQWEDILYEDVVIELYKGDTFLKLVKTTYSTGGYKWEVPISLDKGNDYKIKIKSVSDNAIADMSDNNFAVVDTIAAVEQNGTPPLEFSLSQNYPNPFNPFTSIEYSIPKSSFVTLKVYDLLGKEVVTLVENYQPANLYKVNFDASALTSGVYFYTIQVGDFIKESKKMIVLK